MDGSQAVLFLASAVLHCPLLDLPSGLTRHQHDTPRNAKGSENEASCITKANAKRVYSEIRGVVNIRAL